jgi:AcrR family transcriptional regulator
MAAQPRGTGTVVSRPMRRDALRNQELVLQAAREVISEFGTEASMDQVASRAGVGVGTVYRHFPNKEALVDELVRIILDDLNESAEAALALGDGTGLEIFLWAMARSMSEHHGYSAKLVGAYKAECAKQLYSSLSRLLAQAKEYHLIGPDVTAADLRVMIWGVRGIVATTGSTARAWERYLDIHLTGLRMPAVPSSHPALTEAQLDEINAAQLSN